MNFERSSLIVKTMLISLMLLLICSLSHSEWISEYVGYPGFALFVADSGNTREIAGISGSGFWLTNDGGSNWDPINIEYYTGNISGGLLYDANGDTIILEIISNDNPLIAISCDGGYSWEAMDESFIEYTSTKEHIVIDENDPDKWYYLSDYYFALTENGREEWQVQEEFEYYVQKNNYSYNSEYQEHYYCANYRYNTEYPDRINGFMRSDDDGETWSNMIDIYSLYGIESFRCMDIVKLDSVRILACGYYTQYIDEWDTGNIFLTENNGDTWERIFSNVAPRYLPYKMLVDRYQSNVILLIGRQKHGVYKSIDSGYTWDRLTNGLPSNVSYTNSIWQNRFSGDIYLALEGGGVYRSNNHGENWEEIQGPSLGSPGELYQFGASYYFRDISTRCWFKESIENDWQEIAVPTAIDTICMSGPILYAVEDTIIAYQYRRPFYTADNYYSMIISSDMGESWRQYSEIPFIANNGYMWSYLFQDTTYFYFSSSNPLGLWVSSDYGQQWRQSSLPNSDFPYRLVEGDDILCCSGANDIYLSYDNGVSWQETNHPGSYLGWIASPVMRADNDIYVRSDSLYWRYHEGEWSIQGEYPYNTYSIISAVRGEDTVLVANGFSDIWFSEDYGVTWHVLQESFPHPNHTHKIEEIYFDEINCQIWVSTAIGMYRLPISSLSVPNYETKAQPGMFLFDAYPNPFNASLTITYNLPGNKPAKAKIYNVVGKLVREMDLPSTKNEYVVDMSTWASGAYFLVVQTDSQVQTKKVMMVK